MYYFGANKSTHNMLVKSAPFFQSFKGEKIGWTVRQLDSQTVLQFYNNANRICKKMLQQKSFRVFTNERFHQHFRLSFFADFLCSQNLKPFFWQMSFGELRTNFGKFELTYWANLASLYEARMLVKLKGYFLLCANILFCLAKNG